MVERHQKWSAKGDILAPHPTHNRVTPTPPTGKYPFPRCVFAPDVMIITIESNTCQTKPNAYLL
jgi:hypothetical protein